MIRKFLFVFLNIFLLLILSIALFEFFLRNFGQNIFVNSDAPSYIHIDHIKKNKDINNLNSFDKNYIRYSEDKLIDDYLAFIDIEIAKKEKCKILFLGDSYIQGDGLDINHTYPYILKDKYKKKCKIFSIGFNGYSSYDLIEYYNKNLKNLNIDKLILNVSYNDLVLDNNSIGYLQDKKKIKFQNIYLKDSIFKNFDKKIKKRIDYVFSALFNNVFESGRFIYGALKPTLSYSLEKRLENGKNLIQINGYSKDDLLKKSFLDEPFNQWLETINEFYLANEKKVNLFLAPLDKNEILYYEKIETFLNKKKINYIFCKESYLDFNGLNFERKYWSNLANPHGGKEYHQQYAKCFIKKFMINYDF